MYSKHRDEREKLIEHTYTYYSPPICRVTHRRKNQRGEIYQRAARERLIPPAVYIPCIYIYIYALVTNAPIRSVRMLQRAVVRLVCSSAMSRRTSCWSLEKLRGLIARPRSKRHLVDCYRICLWLRGGLRMDSPSTLLGISIGEYIRIFIIVFIVISFHVFKFRLGRLYFSVWRISRRT